MKRFICILISALSIFTSVYSDDYKHIIINTTEGAQKYELDNLKKITYDKSSGSYVMIVSMKDGNTASIDIDKLATIKFQAAASDENRGDANADGYITVTDIVAIANHILGNTPEGFNELYADADNSSDITVTDIVYVAQYILNGQWPTKAQARRIILNDEMLRRLANLDVE